MREYSAEYVIQDILERCPFVDLHGLTLYTTTYEVHAYRKDYNKTYDMNPEQFYIFKQIITMLDVEYETDIGGY